MFTAINFISEKFFHKKLEEASPEEIKVFVDQYPYSGAARLLLAKKLWKEDEQAALTASLYINNPLRVNWLLQTEDQLPKAEMSVSPSPATVPGPTAEMPEETETTVTAEPDAPIETTPTYTENTAATGGQVSLPGIAEINRIRNEENKPGIEAEPLVFQSYHTIDYFASQGIRLQQSDLSKDKFGQQLRSFTDWLRSMKKLPSTSPTDASFGNDTVVIRNAAISIEEKEILTEAMAEVWAKQGNRERAIATYTKLSLQNPHKSAYFASKIDQLKQA